MFLVLTYKSGNILNDDADWLVNPVNCVGIMGAGLAKQFKNKYPDYYIDYKEVCSEFLTVGVVHLYPFYVDSFAKFFGGGIISFPTKKHWKDKSQLAWIKDGLENIIKLTKINPWFKPNSIAFPKLGCGCGRLLWSDVEPLLINFAEELQDVEVRIYV